MATSTLRYVQLDFSAQQQAILARIQERWPTVWNDFVARNMGNLLVDIISYASETTAYLINRAAQENFVSTLTLPESAIRIGNLVGYRLSGPSAASVMCEASIASPASADVTISAGTAVTGGATGSIPFEVAQDYTISAGATTPQSTVLQITPFAGGANTLQTAVSAVTGQSYLTCVDDTIDLTQYIEAGQTVLPSPTDGKSYVISSITTAAGAAEPNKINLATPWASAAGNIPVTIVERRIEIVQGQTVSDTVTSPSTSTPTFQVLLTQSPVIEQSWSVTVNGIAWTYTDSLTTSDSDDQDFEVRLLANGSYLITFGDGTFGSLIPTSATVVVTYRVGGGPSGNVAINTIATSIVGLLTSLSSPLTVTLTNNYSAGQGGVAAESVEQARVNIPAAAIANDRAVTLSDYQTIALQFNDPNYGQVRYAQATELTANGLVERNLVAIYAWTTGASGGLVPLSAGAKTALQTFIQDRAVASSYVMIADGTSSPVPVSLRVLTTAGGNLSLVESNVETTITNQVNALTPGQPLVFSNLVSALATTSGVVSFDIATPVTDLQTTNSEELLTAPDDTYEYTITLVGVTGNQYQAQSPIFPLAVWSFSLTLGNSDLTIVPDLNAGYAWLLDSSNVGSVLDTTQRSVIDLRTGAMTLYINGSPGTLTMQLTTVQVYDSVRTVDIYIGYTATNYSASSRNQIRSVLQSWVAGLGIGGTLYGVEVPNLLASQSNVTAVVENITGVLSVNNVSLESPGNTETSVQAGTTEVLAIGNIILNNQIT